MVNLLFKKDGVYVVIPEIDNSKRGEVENNPDFLFDTLYKNKISLYGGRVSIISNYSDFVYLIIDGIYIRIYGGDLEGTDSLSINTAAAYLNQIENLGVDTFLQNYKVQVQAIKDQLTEMSNQLAAEIAMKEDEVKSKMLAKIRKVLMSLILLVCTLSIHLNAGLDNYQYIDAYESVISQYAV